MKPASLTTTLTLTRSAPSSGFMLTRQKSKEQTTSPAPVLKDDANSFEHLKELTVIQKNKRETPTLQYTIESIHTCEKNAS